MDRFILLSTLIVFAGLVQTVANARLVKKGKTDLARRMDSWSRVVYAVVLAIILVVAFVL
jgi:predicted CDP-diglyceride synthetase/phosphatidate cytidylyltransferase